MSTARKFRVLMLCALLTAIAHGQQGQVGTNKLGYAADKANLPDAIAKVKSGEFALVHVEMIAEAGAVQAIPILKEQFARSQDSFVKAKIASAVVRLGDKDDTYWDFLAKQATTAVESDAPDFLNFDPKAKTSAGPSPEFIAWASAHKVSPNEAGEDSMYWLPGKVMILASTGDRRAIPLLRQGLLSPNHQIEAAGAMGLAEIQDKDSIPLIVEACKRASPATAALIAEWLVYFDEVEAKSAVDTYIPKDRAKILRKGRAQGKKTPFIN